MKSEDLKKFLEQQKEGGSDSNPIMAGLSLLTFGKSIPINVIKAVVLAVLIYVLINIGLYFLGVDWWIQLIALIGGLIGGVILAFTGSIRFVAHSFIDSVSELLVGTLNPIESIYQNWQATSNEKISKKEFTMNVLQQVVVPNVLGSISKLPFKNTLSKNLSSIIGNIATDQNIKTQKLAVKEVGDNDDDDPTFLSNMIGTIEHSASKTRRGLNAPFKYSLWFFIGFSVVLLVLSYLI